MYVFAIVPLLSWVVGPVAAGFIAESLGWRWVFRLLIIGVGLRLAVPKTGS